MFNIEFRTINELRDLVNRPPNVKYKQLAVRTWFKFLKDNEIVPFSTIIEWKDKIKVNARSSIDSYVPNKGEITRVLDKLKDKCLFEYICVRIMLESGARGSEYDEFAKIIRFKDLSSPEFPVPKKEENKIMYIALPIGKNILMANDIPESMGRVNENENRSKIAISAESKEEADKLFTGLSAGGQIECEIADSPWGSYFGMFRDK